MQTVEKFSISMPLDMASDVRATVEAGEFATTSEAIRDAVRVWRRLRLEESERLAVLRARVRASLDDPRPAMTLAEVDAQLAARFETAKQAEQNAKSAR